MDAKLMIRLESFWDTYYICEQYFGLDFIVVDIVDGFVGNCENSLLEQVQTGSFSYLVYVDECFGAYQIEKSLIIWKFSMVW